MTSLRNTEAATRLRRAHEGGKPVLLAIEAGVLIMVVVTVSVASISQSSAALAAAFSVSSLGALILIFAASVALPANAPRAPSWFAAQRASRTARPSPANGSES